MTEFWHNKKVLVTGGNGFIGRNLVKRLSEIGANVYSLDYMRPEESKEAGQNVHLLNTNLLNYQETESAISGKDIVVHLAARIGDVSFIKAHPASIYYNNMQMFMNLIEASRKANIDRLLVVSSACVYPSNCSIPTPEEEGFMGLPDSAHEGHAWSKRMEEFLTMAYSKEYNFKAGIARLYNVYGPGDHFDAESPGVIPALIKKVFESKDRIEIWGDGNQSRSFLYIDDCIEGLLAVCEKYAVADPLNIGSGEEVKIKDIIRLIIELSGREVNIDFDDSKPKGQLRRLCDTRKAIDKIGFKSEILLREGLKKTVEWYRRSRT